MDRLPFALAAVALLAACDGGRDSASDLARAPCGASIASPGGTLNPQAWVIGPGDRSVNMPRHPAAHPEGWSFDFPQPDRSAGHAHYVTHHHGPLAGKSRIVVRYRVEAAEGVQFINDLGGPGTITLYFQRRGDDWTAGGDFQFYRWFAQFLGATGPLTPGEHELVAPIDAEWLSVMNSLRRADNPDKYAAAIANAQCVGLVMGGGSGLGHGVHATAPARFVMTEFRVE